MLLCSGISKENEQKCLFDCKQRNFRAEASKEQPGPDSSPNLCKSEPRGAAIPISVGVKATQRSESRIPKPIGVAKQCIEVRLEETVSEGKASA